MHQRSPSRAAIDTRHAKTLVAPFLASIGAWQLRAAHGAAIIDADRMDSADRAVLLTNLAHLSAEIGVTIKRLHDALAAEEPGLAGNSHIKDVQRALSSLSSKLREILEAGQHLSGPSLDGAAAFPVLSGTAGGSVELDGRHERHGDEAAPVS